MRKLRIGIVEILGRRPAQTRWSRFTRMNHASIMPQVLAVWCEEAGHEVFLSYYGIHLGTEALLPDDLDLVMIASFTHGALVAYALSSFFRNQGAITLLGGPHARSYPQDAVKHFDYVLGKTDKVLVLDVLNGLARHRPLGVSLSAASHPRHLPPVAQRLKFLEPHTRNYPGFRLLAMMGSFGCPYTCPFCIDAAVPYQPLDLEPLKADLRFLVKHPVRYIVGWHDPNFGVRFEEFLSAIEEAAPPGSLRFGAESTLSLLKEKNVQRLHRNGFSAILPGIESWFDLGNKAKTRQTGMEKVRLVADQINMILRYVPHLQGNFVVGLDSDLGDDSFELTKRFVDLAPGAFPGYSMLSAFGRNSPLNLEYQRQNRVLPLPFHFLNNVTGNVLPEDGDVRGLYDRYIRLRDYSFSKRAAFRRVKATLGLGGKALNLVRSTAPETVRTTYLKELRRRMDHDPQVAAFFSQQSSHIPAFFTDQIKQDLGPLWDLLPKDALDVDHHAYLNDGVEV